ncbi:uncharacterized protein LOC133794222 [Humulus lupulus]|uniref:uncharacterized protein LOC133794222 n=1 Tax=Humulus lupulus TaxID=3486 RepID=UPI002B40761D|nr:uncharacterized protein LOC133794222 [Humulus lupulus]
MAYYSPGYYQNSSDLGEYHQTPYAYNSNDFFTDQGGSVTYSAYKEPSFYNLFDYNIPTHYNYSADYNHSYNHIPSTTTTTRTAYSVFTSTEPMSVQYHDPVTHYKITYNHQPPTQFVISYDSVSPEFAVPEFDDYDPTPYDGGFDITQTYGKPLPPSTEICYPNSATGATPPPSNAEAKKKEKSEPQNGLKPNKADNKEEERKPSHDSGRGDETHKPKPKPEQSSEEPLSVGIGNGFEYEKQASSSLIPSGYGLEAMDLCESLFGYWPCLSRHAKRSAMNNCCGCHDYGFYEGINCGNQWNGAADYLFGGSDPYVEKRDGGGSYGQPIHCYEKHYRETPLYIRVQAEEDSWSQNFNIF